MELAAPGHMRQGRDIDRFIQMRHEVVPKTSKHRSVENAVRRLGLAGVAPHKRVDEAARRLVPKESAARVISCALFDQQQPQMQQVCIVARHSVEELGRERALLRRRQGQPGWLYADQQRSGIRATITCRIDAGGQHRKRALRGLRRKGFSGDTTMGRPLRHEGDYMLMQGGAKCAAPWYLSFTTCTPLSPAAPPATKTDGAAPSAWIAEMSPMLENMRGRLSPDFVPTMAAPGRRSVNSRTLRSAKRKSFASIARPQQF